MSGISLSVCENKTAVQHLLRGIENFLQITLASELLSLSASREREKLLQEFSKCFPFGVSAETVSSYLNMDGINKETDENDAEEYVHTDVKTESSDVCYEEFQETIIQSPAQTLPEKSDEIITIFDKLSVNELQTSAVKFGPLLRKEKFIFLDQYRKSWAGLLGHALLIYSGEQDGRPASVIDLRGYKARPAPCYIPKDSKKRDACFEVVCPGKKTYYFIARTAKDMDQWINAICQMCADEQISFKTGPESCRSYIVRKLPSIPPSEKIDIYDDIATHYYGAVEEDIYNDISDNIHDDKFLAGNTKTYTYQQEKNDSDKESIYDDIGDSFTKKPYYSQTNDNDSIVYTKNTLDNNAILPPEKHSESRDSSLVEEIYDDIESYSKTAKTY